MTAFTPTPEFSLRPPSNETQLLLDELRAMQRVLAAKWIEPSWSREIQETLADPEVERSGADLIASLDRLVEFIYEVGRTPVVVVDDSDRWLNTSADHRDEILEGFFRETARMLAERNWGVLLAVHPEYYAAPSFRQAVGEGFLNSQREVPRLPDADVLMRLVEARIARRAEDADEESLAAAADAEPSAPRSCWSGGRFRTRL
jgi:hypothetical protein